MAKTLNKRAERLIERSIAFDHKIDAEIEDHKQRLTDLKNRRGELWREANIAGATYVQIIEKTGRSSGLVCREIGAAIKRNGS